MRTIRPIASGAFGLVEEVEDDRGRRVARKSFDPPRRPPPERDKLLARFRREVRIQSQIHHPNVMELLEHDLEAEPPWFTMPLASDSLQEKIKRDHAAAGFDPSPWQDILAGVEELHRLGFVHRDLKPANILRVDDVWVLTDFGLVLPMTRDTTTLTGPDSVYGSQFYAAPEQTQDFKNTPEQADIFALGCILHDAVEAQPRRVPFAQIQTSGPYAALIEKATEVDVDRRIPSVAAFRAALFDLWNTSDPSPRREDEANLLAAVVAHVDEPDSWRPLIAHLEGMPLSERQRLLRSIDAAMIARLGEADELLFARLATLLCAWAQSADFPGEYGDLVGDRLLEAYRHASTRVGSQIVLAALDLAASRHRWHVMIQVGAMLGPEADEALIDRLLIEIELDPGIVSKLRRIETTVSWPRDRWHPRLAALLSRRDVSQAE